MHHRFHLSHSVLFWAHTCKSFLPYFDASWSKCCLWCQIEGWTAGWFMAAFNPSCIPSSLRPLLSSPVIRVIWMFLLPLVCQLFLFPGLFSSMVFCKFLPHSGRGADLVEAVVDSLEEVSRGKLFSLLPGPLLVALTGRPSTFIRRSSSELSRLHA